MHPLCWSSVCLSLVVLPQLCSAETTRLQPNIVVILADDLGYGDVHSYNPQRGKIPTPHLDRLALQGMRFTDAHSSSGVCSPSRYALLTGRYHWRTRLQAGIVNVWGAPLIAPDRLTIGSLAKQQGYRTACIGKWHLGSDWPISEEQRPYFADAPAKAEDVTEAHREAWKGVFSQPIPGGPTTRGFDRYFGTDVPNWPPYCFIENDRTVGIPSAYLPKEKLLRLIASKQGPALTGWQFEPILPALADRASAFVTEAAAAKQRFLLYLPLTTPHTPLSVNEPWRGKSGLDSDVADLIMETDAAIGRVLAALDATGTADNTLVIMTSDNGFAPYAGAKELEARGHYPSGPLRGYKADVYEGGHRIPFIVRWPPVVKAGTVCNQLVHHADVIATLAEVWGATLPATAGEDSFSLMPLLKGGERPIREHAVSCASSGVPGFRLGDWKLILAADPQSKSAVQLYNLADDLREKNNLAEAQPERVAQMKSQFEDVIRNGRSTPGPTQKNDIAVRRYPQPAPAAKKKAASTQ